MIHRGQIPRQPANDRQHHRQGAPRGRRRKRGERNQAIGISRGRSTKIHALVDGKGRPLHFVVTGGQAHDNQVVGELLQAANSAWAVTADKAYDSKAVRQQIEDDGAVPVIPSLSNACKQARCPKRIYRKWRKLENFVCRIKDWRRLATRFDKLGRNVLAATWLVAALHWITP